MTFRPPVRHSPSMGVVSSDGFVLELNDTGTLLEQSTYLGGSGDEWANKIAVDAAGTAHVTGYTTSSDFPVVNAAQPTPGGQLDAFVAKIGDPTCGVDVGSRVKVVSSSFLPIFSSLRLQFVFIRNHSGAPIDGPVTLVLDDLQNAELLNFTPTTSCFSTPGARSWL